MLSTVTPGTHAGKHEAANEGLSARSVHCNDEWHGLWHPSAFKACPPVTGCGTNLGQVSQRSHL